MGVNKRDMDVEQWRVIHGYAHEYKISNSGRFYYPERTVRCVNQHGGEGSRTIPARVTSGALDKAGYRQVSLKRKCGKAVVVRVHTLVAKAFLGARPSETHVVCHRDGSKENNNVANLRWDTQRGNLEDARRHGTLAQGEKLCRAEPLTNAEAKRIRVLYATGKHTQREVAEIFNTSADRIGKIVRGVSWACAGGPITRRKPGRPRR